jgi:hypothetical protein
MCLLAVVERTIEGDKLREGSSFKKSQRWSVIAVTSSRGQRTSARFPWSRWPFRAATETLGDIVDVVGAEERMALLSTERRRLKSSVGNLETLSRNGGRWKVESGKIVKTMGKEG